MLNKFVKGSNVFVLLWIFVFLGSCSVVQVDNRTMLFSYALNTDVKSTPTCTGFKRTTHIGHKRPGFPKVDISRLPPEDINDILLAYSEKVAEYMDKEEKYLAEDIARHNQICGPNTGAVFQK